MVLWSALRTVRSSLKFRDERVRGLGVIDRIEHDYEQTSVAFGRVAIIVGSYIDPFARRDIPTAALQAAAFAAQVAPLRFVSTAGK